MSLLNMPWYVFLLIGMGVIYLSTTPFFQGDQRIAEIQAALSQDAPHVVQLKNYERPNGVKFAEAVIEAQIVTAETARLFRRSGGTKSIGRTEYAMIVLADRDATQTPRQVKGLIVVEKADAPDLDAFIAQNQIAEGPLGPIVNMGAATSGYDSSTQVKTRLAERNMRLASNVVYFEPFFDGREADLRQMLTETKSASTKVMLLGIGICLIGIFKYQIERFMSVHKRAEFET
ncbi:MAG: hypothetical protein AAGF55_11910 [Pseudomonadota bacterium]